MKWLKKRLKSWTHIWTTLSGVVGILEVNFGLFREYLGIHYGWCFVLAMVVGYLLREKTKQPVEEK